MAARALALSLLLVAAACGARIVLRHPRIRAIGPWPEPLLAGWTVFTAWCLVSAALPATVAELTGWRLVTLPVVALVAALGAVIALGLCGRAGDAGQHVLSGARQWRRALRRVPRLLVLLCLAPVVALHACLLADALLRPPMGSDGLFYHLPNVVRWLQDGRLDIVPGIPHASTSGNGDLWLMFVAAMRCEPLIELGFVPLGLVLALTGAAIGRQLGAGRIGAACAALFTLVTPMIALQMYSSFVDLFGTTFLLLGLYYFLLLLDLPTSAAQRGRYVLMAGLSLGIAVGTKVPFAMCAAPVGVAILVVLVRRHGTAGSASAPRRGRQVALAALLLVAGLLPSSFWYFRAAYQAGWLFYPLRITIAGRTFGTGMSAEGLVRVPHEGLASLAYPWFEWKASGYPYSEGSGVGPQIATFAPAALVYLLLRGRRAAEAGRRAARAVGVGLALGLLLYLTVFQSHPRYAFPLWTLCLAASAPLLDDLLRRAPRAVLPLVCVSLCLAAAMTGLRPAKNLAGRLRDGALSRAQIYEVPPLFDELPPGTVVLSLADGHLNYPLLGRHWSTRLVDLEAAVELGLTPPLTRDRLRRHAIELVYVRGSGSAPFGGDASFETVFDDADDPSRRPTTAPTRVYRVLPGMSGVVSLGAGQP